MANFAFPSNTTDVGQFLSEIDAFLGVPRDPSPLKALGITRSTSLLQDADALLGIGSILSAGGIPSKPIIDAEQNPLNSIIGRGVEFSIATARGALALPAGIERVAALAIEKLGISIPEPLQAFQERTVLAQELTRAVYGLEDESILINLAGEVAGGILGVVGGLRAINIAKPAIIKALGKQFGPAVYRGLSMPEMIAATKANPQLAQRLSIVVAGGAEAMLFEAGLPDTKPNQIALAGLLGISGGALIQKLAVRRAAKLRSQFGLSESFPGEVLDAIIRGDPTHPVAPRFTKFLANMDAQDDLLSTAAIFEEVLDDQAVASIAISLQRAGEKGTIGHLRGAKLTNDQFLQLHEAFPNYRFELVPDAEVGQTLLFGLRPSLRKGNEVGFLTDSAIGFYNKNKFMLGQRVIVDGQEGVIMGAEKGIFKIRDPFAEGGALFKIDPSRVMFLDDVRSGFGTESLFQKFVQFQDSSNLDWEDAFKAFTKTLPDFDTSLTQPLRTFFVRNEINRINSRITPDAAADLAAYRKALARTRSEGAESGSLELMAASRRHMITPMSQGRVKLTKVSGPGAGNTTLFPNPARASEYLQEFRMDSVLDLSPNVGGIPHELLAGTVRSGSAPNPSIFPDFEAAGISAKLAEGKLGFIDAFLKGPRRAVQLMEPRGQQLERVVQQPIWTQGMQAVSLGATRAMNKSFPFLERIRIISKGVKSDRNGVIRGWLTSELSDVYQAANRMSDKEVQAARAMRKLFNDLFDDLSKSANIELNADVFFRNYAPDIQEHINVTGSVDGFEQIWTKRGQQLPNEVKYFAEHFKSGELSFLEQENIFALGVRTVRAGMFKAEAGPAFEQAVQFAKTVTDPDAQRFLVDYLMSIRGFPGLGKETLGKFADDMFKAVGVRLSPQEIGTMTDDLFLANASSLMGWRMALLARNMTQNMQMLAPLLDDGFSRVAKSMVKAGTKSSRSYAESIGAIRKQLPLARAEIADITLTAASGIRQTARDLARKSLRPYSSSDEWNRAVSAITVRDAFDANIERFASGKINLQQFIRKFGLHVQDIPVQNKFIQLLNDKPANEARDFAAREMANFTQFMYGASNSPAWVRTTPGKLFGNFGTFSYGYLNWVARAAAAPTISDKISIFAKHGMVNAALFSAKGLRINLLSWAPFAALTYTGGPFTQVAGDVMAIMGGVGQTVRGNEPGIDFNLAMARLPGHAKLLIPGGILFTTDVKRAANRLDEGAMGLAILEALGVRTVDEQSSGSAGIGVR